MQRITVLVWIAWTLFWAEPSYALNYCAKPNGLALRGYAKERLAPMMELVNKQVGLGRDTVYVVKVPPEEQRDRKFLALQKDALREAFDSPEYADMFAAMEEMSIGGENRSLAQIKNELLESVSKPSSIDELRENGAVYLFSQNYDAISRLSPDIATADGLVAVGTKGEVDELLGMRGNPQNRSWWERLARESTGAIVAVGFDPNPEIRSIVGPERFLLKVANWKTAVEHGLTGLRSLISVDPENAMVFNFFPRTGQDAEPWGFSADKAQLYAENGVLFQEEYRKFGYQMADDVRGLSVKDVVNRMAQSAEAGKTVLVIAETALDANGDAMMRIPGVSGGLSMQDFARIDKRLMERIFLISCNSNLMSEHLLLSLVGTVYSDSANRLIRMTFAQGQRDSFSNYIEAGAGVSDYWLGAVGQAAARISAVSIPAVDVSVEPAREYRPVAYVYRLVSAVPAGAAPQAAPAIVAREDGTRSLTQEGWLLFLSGVLGAACREGLRWKRLIEQGKKARYLKLPYVVLSIALALCAGFVGLIFARLVWIDALRFPVAFVAGAGLEKLVEMASRLKIWVPRAAMGQVDRHPEQWGCSAENDRSLRRLDVLKFLRHGD